MLIRLAVLVILSPALGSTPASAQYTVVDANGTVLGSVIGVYTNPPWQTAVARQDPNGVWIMMEVFEDVVNANDAADAYYLDASCATTPYIRFPAPNQSSNAPGVTLFGHLFADAHIADPVRYYAGDPIQTLAFQSHAVMTRGVAGGCQPTDAQTQGPWKVGPMQTFDLTQFVPPFTVQ